MGDFSRQHGYIQWGGSIIGGETWSCGLRVGALGGFPVTEFDPDNTQTEELLDHYAAKVKAFHGRSSSCISNRALLEFVKFNVIKVDGHYRDDPSHSRFFAPIAGNGAGSIWYPNQVSLCITLTTAVTRGPANKGRFYLPPPSMEMESNGMISAATATLVRGSVRTLLEDISDTPGIDGLSSPDVAVFSRKDGAPAAHYVTGLRVGRVLDTQRRRRRSLKENYVTDVVDFGAL